MIVKLVYKAEIRICSTISSFSDILKQVKTLFPTAPIKPHLSYVDSDGDTITISSAEDIVSLKAYANGKIMKINIGQSQSKQIAVQNEDHDQFEIIIDEEKLLSEIVSKNLDKVYTRAIDRFEDEQQEMVNQLAKFHVYQIGQKAISNALSQLNTKQYSIKIESTLKPKSPRSKSFDNVKSQKQIQKLVDKKLKQLLPTIVQRASKLVEMRSKRVNKNCSNCTKYKKIISQTYLNTDICNEEDIEQVCRILEEKY